MTSPGFRGLPPWTTQSTTSFTEITTTPDTTTPNIAATTNPPPMSTNYGSLPTAGDMHDRTREYRALRASRGGLSAPRVHGRRRALSLRASLAAWLCR
jgi:hypothetical protein